MWLLKPEAVQQAEGQPGGCCVGQLWNKFLKKPLGFRRVEEIPSNYLQLWDYIGEYYRGY